MFSTVESEDSRFLRCWKAPVECMSECEMHAESAVAIPKYLAREELRVRVADLIDGIAIESRALGELRAAEAGIRAGFDELVVHLEALARYDDGDEILIEPTREDRGTPPAGWVRMAGRG